ncbi:MAG: CPBP family intramembrane glutamic endopeptidase [Chthoniobacterales bacterium]
MKDAVRLAGYFLAVILLGAFLAPPLFWTFQALARHEGLKSLGGFEFEQFFHRSLLIAALLLLWPLLRSLNIRRLGDLGLRPNARRWRDLAGGLLIAIVPLALCGVGLIGCHMYSLRPTINWPSLLQTIAAAFAVPIIEETFFRGLVLGILLRSGRKCLAVLITSALFSIIHFLKAPEGTSAQVAWDSGFQSIAHAFLQFGDPVMVLAGFSTLFLIGYILADSRIRTASLWLPIGLHAGWILGNGVFNRIARLEATSLPWLGRNLLVGLIPLAVLGLTWIIVRIVWSRENRV